MKPAHDTSVPSPLPVNVDGGTVSVCGPLTASTIALICAAVDYVHDVGTHAVTVDLRALSPGRAIDVGAIGPSAWDGSGDRVVRLLLPLHDPLQ